MMEIKKRKKKNYINGMPVEFNEIKIISRHNQAYWEHIKTLCVGGITLNV